MKVKDCNADLFADLQKYVEKIAQEPGVKLESENVLAEKFGVTRYRIRKALDRLRQVGVLDSVKRRGSIVKSVDQSALSENLTLQMNVARFNEDEYNEARAVLECAVIPLVCKRQTPALIGSLTDEVAAVRAFANSPLKADKHLMNFHLLLIQGCGNRVLQTLSSIVIRYFSSTHELIENAPTSYFLEAASRLEDIIFSIKASNPDKTVKLLNQYLVRYRSYKDNKTK